MSGGTALSAAAQDAEAWNQAEREVGSDERAVSTDETFGISEGEERQRLSNAANFGVRVDESGNIGARPGAEEDRQPERRIPAGDRRIEPPTQHNPSQFDRPRGTPVAPEAQEPASRGPGQREAPENDADAQAEAEFWPEEPSTNGEERPSSIAEERAQNRRDKEENEQERMRMRGVAEMIDRDPIGVAARLRNVSRDEMLHSMQQQGLVPRAHQHREDPPQYEEDRGTDGETDPQTRALTREVQGYRAELQQMRATQADSDASHRQREERREHGDYLREKDGALRETRKFLAEKVQMVPSLRNSGELAPALVDNAMLTLDRDYDEVLRSGRPIKQVAIGLLRSAAEERALSPAARAKKAGRQRRGKARPPAPTRVMETARHAEEPSRQPPRRKPNYADPDVLRRGAAAWFAEYGQGRSE